jgi:RNA polymerase sigma-70 factor (ECF subfamily)
MGVDRDSELALVARWRQGDATAFDAVYDAYRSRLFGFLLRLTHRREVAEDLLEETWMRAVAHAPRLDPATRLGPWLFTVARNLFWSHCRSRQVETAGAAQLVGLWPAPTPPPSPFDDAAAGEFQGRVFRALARLPAIHREVLLLVGVEGLTPAEAATVCQVSPEALRKRLSRARALLGAVLAGEPGAAARPARSDGGAP